MTIKAKFYQAYRAQRLMKHRFAATAAMKHVDIDMLKLALNCRRYPDGYFTSGGVWFARQAAKNGYSFKYAIKSYLKAVKYRKWRSERIDLFPNG